MYLSKRGLVAAAALLAGCSGEIGSTPPVAGGSEVTPGTPEGGDNGAEPGEGPAAAPVETINPDGSVTITNPDGSTMTVAEDGTVIASTPPTQEPPPTGTETNDPEGATNTPTTTPPVAQASRCEPGTPQSSQLPRLTNRQYDNTITALLGVDLQLAATTLQADSKGNMDARSWQSYQDAAATVAATILTDATARAAAVPCSTQDAACASQIISDFGAKVFRRPLTPAEVTRYEALFADTTLTETGTFDEQIQVVFQALFQSPYFLSIAEISETPSADASGTERFALNDYELASRLSYMLWDSMPDDALLAAAAAGTLSQGTGIAEQAARMLQDERAKGLVQRLHMDYMRMGENTRWTGYTRDAAAFPAYSAAQTQLIAQETIRVAEAVVFAGGSFAELMTTTIGYVNADTAPLYGLDPAQYGAELTQVDLGPARPGLLTRAGFLAANAYGNRTSPIHRGAFIMKEVLCTPLGDPDPDALTTPLPNDPSLITNREKTVAQTSIGADCIACHQSMINPAGFALEGFDAVGGVQLTDNGAAINTAADVVIGASVVPVAGASDLMAAIAAAPEAQRCYTENWVQVAYNRVLSAQDACTVDQIAQKMSDPEYSVTGLISDLASVETFRFRAHETEVTQ